MTRSARHSVSVGSRRSVVRRIGRILFWVLVAIVAGLSAFWYLVRPGLVRAADRIPSRVHAGLRAHGAPYTPLSRISPFMQYAIVAIEDRRFYQNKGFDPHAMVRAVFTDVSTWHFDQGGATLTDQLVERTVPLPVNIIQRGVRILAVAATANACFDKARILELYLNSVYYGRGAYGIGAAARIYFRRTPLALNLAQASFLAALPQAPSYYGRHPFAPVTQTRWRTVITDMRQQGYVTRAQAHAATREGIRLA